MRKIAVFTGTRAEYGLLSWVIQDLQDSDDVELQLLVGGMHLSPEFGMTVSQIEADGIPIAERLEFVLSSDTSVGMSKSMGLATISAAEAFARQRPDLLVLLGDRYEAIAIALAAMSARIPIAHIHGGESTQGLIDEAIRHAVTKLSHLHFTATDAYRRRVVQLGEDPSRVFNVGAPGVDGARRLALLDLPALRDDLGFDLRPPYVLATYHPVTLSPDGAVDGLRRLLRALAEQPNHQVVMTYPNSDAGGRRIIPLLERFRDTHPGRVLLAKSLGQLRYLSLMQHAAAVVGNSSSGLIEAPAFGVPTLDIGERQRGRIAGPTVVRVPDDEASIRRGIAQVLDPTFAAMCTSAASPYGGGDASRQIVEILVSHRLDDLLEKSFYDIEVNL
ncbi:MAG TPA: UDP-N-acetylglucosamine 2-epimerase [Nocardioides sp.]|uniref:UDP-N-acetylglucosamine 2-epimerase n=1 Tax=Nocardioides sp. TaxID=35761 RepID=UPI002EDB9074